MKDKNEYKIYKNNLDSTFSAAFEKIELFIISHSRLTIEEKDNCLQQVLDDFLTAQKNGVSLVKVTGPDLSKYCANMAKSELEGSNNIKKTTITLLCGWMYILLMNLLMLLFKGMEFKNQSNPLSSIEFSFLEVIMLLGFWSLPLAEYFITKKFFYTPEKCKKIKGFVRYIIIIITSLIAVALDGFVPFRIPITVSQLFYISLLLITISLIIISITSRNTLNRNTFEKKFSQKSNIELLDAIYKKKYDFNLSDYETKKHIDDKKIAFISKRKKETLFKLGVFTIIFWGYILVLLMILNLMFTKTFDIFLVIVFIFLAILGLLLIKTLSLGFKELSLLSKLSNTNKH